MRVLLIALRSIFAVLLGIVASTAVAFAIEILLKAVLAPNTSSVGWMLGESLYTVPALMFGYVAAWLAPRRPLAHSAAMAVIQELLMAVLIFNPPHPVPPWIWAIGLIMTPIAIICGGYLRSRPATGNHR
jgi:hypothetical protein